VGRLLFEVHANNQLAAKEYGYPGAALTEHTCAMKAIIMFSHELKVAIRRLLKSPCFATTAVFMLAIGIGATTAVFSICGSCFAKAAAIPTVGAAGDFGRHS
jgi:hypothetical protein